MIDKKYIYNCLFIVVVILIVVGLFFSYRYVTSLEDQVYQRDSLIRELSFSDQLVREYFDVRVDSLNHSRSYTLKDSKKTRIIERQEYSVEVDGKKYSFEQLLQEYFRLVQEYNSLVKDYNILVKEAEGDKEALAESRRTNRSAYHKLDSLYNLLHEKEFYLNSISRTYGFKFQTRVEGNTINYSMKSSPQLDSALRIYPFFKDLAVYDKETGEWIISIPNKKRIESVVKISYR